MGIIGIPNKNINTDVPSSYGEMWDYVIHRHDADVAGLHYDLRLSPPGSDVAYSWAIPKAILPLPYEKVLAVKQPDHCFKAGTLVKTATGLKKIENIVEGEYVYSMSSAGKIELKKVIKTFHGYSPEITKIDFRFGTKGGSVFCTQGHEIYTDKGKILACTLNNNSKPLFAEEWANKEQLQLIYGTLLGDGNISPNGGQIRITHGDKQKDWVLYKYESLKSLGAKLKTDKRGKHTITLTCKDKSLRKQFYKDRKVITKKILNTAGLRGLATLYLDDGSLAQCGSKLTVEFSTQGYDAASIKIFTTWLKNNYDIDTSVYKAGRDTRWGNYDKDPKHPIQIVRITRKDSVKEFFKLITPYLPNIETSIKKLPDYKKEPKKECFHCNKKIINTRKYCSECLFIDASDSSPWEYDGIVTSQAIYQRFGEWPSGNTLINETRFLLEPYKEIITHLGENSTISQNLVTQPLTGWVRRGPVSIPHNDSVYTIEVECNHNYILSNNLIVGNSREYMSWRGTIEDGYGKGKVSIADSGKVEVLESSPDKINFNIYTGTESKRLVLIKTDGNNWLLLNYTPTREKRNIPDYKPKYKDIDIKKLKFDFDNEYFAPKYDGAHAIFQIRKNHGIDVFSYRPSKRSETKIIDHTFKTNLYKVKPNSYDDTLLRGELFGVDKDGKAIPSSVTGGLLNSSVLKSREKQLTEGNLDHVVFDVIRYKGKNVENLPYKDKLEILKTIHEDIPEIKLPQLAKTTEEKQKLTNQIELGQFGGTDEGVIIYKLDQPYAHRSKIKNDFDVYVTNIFEGSGKYAGRAAGGFEYSLSKGGPTVGKVGSGFTDSERLDMWINPNDYIGRVAKVVTERQYHTGSLRIPIFKEWRYEQFPKRASMSKFFYQTINTNK